MRKHAEHGRRMNILLVDDHAIVRSGLRRLLKGATAREVYEASNGRDALAVLKREKLDLIILDLNLPELGGLELLARLRQIEPVPILVFSMHAEPLYVNRALEAGASGYVSKNASPEEIIAAVHRVAGGGRYIEGELAQQLALQPASADHMLEHLSDRDLEIIRLLVQGRSLAEIADALGLGYKTVANTCSLIKAKLGVGRTADLVRLAVRAGVG